MTTRRTGFGIVAQSAIVLAVAALAAVLAAELAAHLIYGRRARAHGVEAGSPL